MRQTLTVTAEKKAMQHLIFVRRPASFPVLGTLLLVAAATAQAQPGLTRGPGQAVTAGPHARSAYAIDVDASVLSSRPDQLHIDIPGQPSALAALDGFERRRGGGVVWRGRLESDSGSQVVITRHKGLIVGTIWVGDQVYEIRPGSDRQAVISELDLASFPPCSENPASPASAADSVAPVVPAKNLGPTAVAMAVADPNAEMHLLAVYTPQARDAEGGVAEIEALIQAAVDNANTALINSDMVGRYVLVHTALANRNDSGSLSSDLGWLDSDPAVAALRNQHGADMVSLMVNSGGCGIGYVQRNPGSGFAGSAFQVTVRDCAVGNLTFAHEHGHNLGMEHDPANGTSPSNASYPWSFGYYMGGNVARTVMAYPSPCSSCPRVMHFSNPDAAYNGFVTGVDNVQDNARTGDLTAPIVHDFRATVHVGGGSSQSFQDGISPTTGYSGTADTYLSENSPSNNLGASAELRADGDAGGGLEDRALLQWDVSQIPAGSVVRSVYLNITVTNATGDNYQIYALNGAWTENEATWNQSSAGTTWQVGGASGTLDRDATLLGILPYQHTGTIGATLNDSGVTAVQAWVNDPTSNAGLIVVSASGADGVFFRSSQYGTASERPRLTVSYDPPASNSAPQFGADPISKSDAPQDAPYSDSLAGEASDPDFDALSYSKDAGPAWLIVADNGALGGTPSASDIGLNNFAVSVSDGRGGSDTATLLIDVVPPPTLESITVTPSSALIEPGATQAFTATGNYSDSTTQDITGSATWASSNTAAATMAGNIATAVAAGSSNITASLDGVTSDAAVLTVTTFNVSGISPSLIQAGVLTPVTISGDGFVAGASLSFQNGSGPSPQASNVVVASLSQITANLLVGTKGPKRDRHWDVAVQNGNGQAGLVPGGLTVTLNPIPNDPPTVAISSPVNGASFAEGANISFSGTASDVEDGTLTSSLSWSSNLSPGPIGSGGSFSAVLSPGNHVITASVTDGGGQNGSSTVSITVGTPNTAPQVAITSPANGSTFEEGVSIGFAANATDNEDGNVAASLNWSSSLQGAIGSGPSFNAVLNPGTHTITAAATDTGGLTGQGAISVTVNSSSSSLTVTGISPSPVSLNAGVVNLTISGTGFVDGATVALENGSGPAPRVNSVSWVSATQLIANVEIRRGGPNRVRFWDVRVTNPGGATAVGTALLQVNP